MIKQLVFNGEGPLGEAPVYPLTRGQVYAVSICDNEGDIFEATDTECVVARLDPNYRVTVSVEVPFFNFAHEIKGATVYVKGGAVLVNVTYECDRNFALDWGFVEHAETKV